jgi:transcription antitermination factor NusG
MPNRVKPSSPFYILIIKEGSEASMAKDLRKESIVERCLYPTVEEEFWPRHRKSKKPLIRKSPRFPGYLFVRTIHDYDWPALREVRGVKGVLTMNGYASTIRWKDLRVFINGQDIVTIEQPAFVDGEQVSIRDGVFEGHIGIYTKRGVLLQLFGGDTRVSVPIELLDKIR